MAIIAELTRKSQSLPIDEARMIAMLRDPKQYADIQSIREQEKIIRECNDKNSPVYKEAQKRKAILKAQLPGFVFQCQCMEEWHKVDKKKNDWGVGRWRSQEHSVLNGLAMIDIDHVDNPRALYQTNVATWMAANPGVVRFVYVSPSGYGLKIVFVASLEHGNLIDNQMWLAQQMGLEIDDSCKDASRLSFASTDKDVLYYDKTLFEHYDEAYSRKYTPEYNKGLSQPDMFKEKKDPIPKAPATEIPENSATAKNPEDYTYMGMKPYEIMEKMLEGVDVEKNGRHNTLLPLVRDARYVCDRNEAIIRANLKHFQWFNDLEKEDPAETARTIKDAMDFKYNAYLPKIIKQIIPQTDSDVKNMADFEKDFFGKFEYFGQQFSDMFRKYPCMCAVCADMPMASYPSIIFAASAMFGTLMTRCSYSFYDKPEVPRRLNYGVMVIADPASRKSHIEYLNKIIMAPVKMADDLGHDAINAYKDALQERATSTKEQKKDALKYPDVKIRIHGTRTANGVFIEDMVKCKEVVNGELVHLHLYTFDSELDSAKIANSGGQWIDKSIFELKAFHNEVDNQQYKNCQSISGPFAVYWNYVYTGTPLSLNRKVTERNFGSGLFSRLAVIPLCADSFEMIPYGKTITKTTQYEEELSKWADILNKVSGKLPLEPLVKEAYDWTKEKLDLAKIEESKKDALLCKRIGWYGINVAAPYVFMRHFREWESKRTITIDDHDKRLCRLVMDIQFYSQNYYFGKMADMYFEEKRKNNIASKVNEQGEKAARYFAQMPQTFTVEDLMKAINVDGNYARVLTHRWMALDILEPVNKGKKNRIYRKKA